MKDLNGFVNEKEIFKNSIIERITMINDELKDERHKWALNEILEEIKEYDELKKQIGKYASYYTENEVNKNKIKKIFKMIDIINSYYDEEINENGTNYGEIEDLYFEKDEIIKEQINKIKGLI